MSVHGFVRGRLVLLGILRLSRQRRLLVRGRVFPCLIVVRVGQHVRLEWRY